MEYIVFLGIFLDMASYWASGIWERHVLSRPSSHHYCFTHQIYGFYLGSLASLCSLHYCQSMACKVMAPNLCWALNSHCLEILLDCSDLSSSSLFMATVQSFSIFFSCLIHLLFPALWSAKIKAMGWNRFQLWGGCTARTAGVSVGFRFESGIHKGSLDGFHHFVTHQLCDNWDKLLLCVSVFSS